MLRGIPIRGQLPASQVTDSGRRAVDPILEWGVVEVRVSLALCLLALVSCRSLTATYDESRSLVPSAGFQAGSVAVIGPPAEAQFPGLAETLGDAIRDALVQRTRSREFVSASDLYARLHRHKGYYQHFGAWLSRYT